MRRIFATVLIAFCLGCVAQARDVNLAWDASSTASSTPGVTYNVYRSDAGAGYIKINTAAVTVLTYTDVGVPDGAVLTYMVTAVGSGAESGGSNAVTLTSPPADPSNLSGSVTS